MAVLTKGMPDDGNGVAQTPRKRPHHWGMRRRAWAQSRIDPRDYLPSPSEVPIRQAIGSGGENRALHLRVEFREIHALRS